MMKRLFLLASLLLLSALAACSSSTTPKPQTNLRIINASPDAGSIQVLLDDKIILSGLGFKDGISYNQIDAGTRNIKLVIPAVTTGTTPTPLKLLLDITPNLLEGHFYSVIAANNAAAIEPIIIDEDSSAPASGKLRVRVVHTAAAAPAVDIYVSALTDDATLAGATPVISNANFKTVSPIIDLNPGDYVVRVTTTGTKNIVFDSGKQTLAVGSNITLFAMEQNVSTSPISLVALSRSYQVSRFEIFDVNAQVRVMNTSTDAPAIDFLVDNVVSQSALAYGANSAYAPILAGVHTFKINSAGSATTLVTADSTITGSGAFSVYVMDVAAKLQVVVIPDFLGLPTAGNAKLRFIHASADTTALDVFQDDSTTAIVSALAFKGGGLYTTVPAGTHAYKLNLAGTATTPLQSSLVLEAGKVYSAVVLGSSATGATKPLELKLITDR
jgi:Domain of unknown function (DUF4397)